MMQFAILLLFISLIQPQVCFLLHSEQRYQLIRGVCSFLPEWLQLFSNLVVSDIQMLNSIRQV